MILCTFNLRYIALSLVLESKRGTSNRSAPRRRSSCLSEEMRQFCLGHAPGRDVPPIDIHEFEGDRRYRRAWWRWRRWGRRVRCSWSGGWRHRRGWRAKAGNGRPRQVSLGRRFNRWPLPWRRRPWRLRRPRSPRQSASAVKGISRSTVGANVLTYGGAVSSNGSGTAVGDARPLPTQIPDDVGQGQRPAQIPTRTRGPRPWLKQGLQRAASRPGKLN